MGISAGAALSAKYIGLFGNKKLIKAYGSISNPYNFARVSFHLENLFWGRVLSKVMVLGFKKGISQHQRNPIFQELIRQNKMDHQENKTQFDQAQTCWELDSVFTYKLGSKYNKILIQFIHIIIQNLVNIVYLKFQFQVYF